VRVDLNGAIKPSADAEVIDAHDRFLMPGLWDNHRHLGGSEDGASISRMELPVAGHGE
jgi:imidazolonepropionase-like amidohydrolase